MPSHSKPKSHGGAAADSKPKTKSPAAGGAGKTRSAVTGRQLGRAAIRSLNKNADAAAEYLDSVLSASSLADLQRLVSSATFLAVVERQAGAGRLIVTLQTAPSRAEAHHANIPIKGVLKFKGRANTDAKKERGNTMQVGDFVIVDGAQAASRLTFAQADRCRRAFAAHALPIPSGFFNSLTSAHEDGEDEEGFAFDRSEEEAAEAAEEEARKAEEARKRIVKAGGAGRGGAPRVSVRDARAALEEREDGEAGAERDEDEDESMPAEGAAGDEPAKPKGPNRAERRAAEARAREEAEAAAAAAAAAAAGFNLYGAAEEDEDDWTAVAMPAARPDKGWEELADELDIDAI